MTPKVSSGRAVTRTLWFMISRLVAACPSCGSRIVLRITVAGGRQPFLFGCPYCHTELRATLVAHIDKAFEFESEDLSLVSNDEEGPDDLAVAVSTDLPVHESLIGQSAADAYASPFIQLMSIATPGEAEDVTRRIERLRGMREQLYPHLRRAAAAWARGDIENMQSVLSKAPGGARIDFAQHDPVSVFGTALAELYAALEDTDARMRAADEFARMVGAARTQDTEALQKVYAEFASPLAEHRARVIETSLLALADPSNLIGALWLEVIVNHAPLNEFRIMRDDFDTLKGHYQDIFEAASRNLAFTARIANLALRSDPTAHVDGKRRTLNVALNRTKAFQREAWVTDFPAANALYERMKRHTRNDIGHRLVRYDFASGALVYDDGSREQYVHFLIDHLNAVRLSHHLLDISEILWHTERILKPSP